MAEIDLARGDHGAALVRYKESIEIVRGLAESLGTPESMLDLSVSLDHVAGIDLACGDHDAALAKYSECLEVRRGLAESHETMESLDDFVWATLCAASCEIVLGAVADAIVRLDLVVDIFVRLEQESDANILDTATRYWEVRSEALEALKRADEAREGRARAAAVRARIVATIEPAS